jgi:hypothetical protein
MRQRPGTRPGSETNLFDWATLVFCLMTGGFLLEENRAAAMDVEGGIRTQAFPLLEEEKLGIIVKRCWQSRYESAALALQDTRASLSFRGYEISGKNDSRGFDGRRLFGGVTLWRKSGCSRPITIKWRRTSSTNQTKRSRIL